MRVVTDVALGDVASVIRTTVEPAKIRNGTFYVGLENITPGGEFNGVAGIKSGDVASTKFVFSEHQVLFGKLRPYLAKVARPDFGGVCSTDILPIAPGPKLDRDYLAYFLSQPAIVALAAQRATGANLPRLSPKELEKFRLPLPSLKEQKRIARVLDAANGLRVKRREILSRLGNLTKSVFVEMFGDPEANPRDWPVGPVSDYVTTMAGGRSFANGDDNQGRARYRILKVSAITSGQFLSSENRPVLGEYQPPTHHFVRDGDLLFSRANTTELVGAVALVHSSPPSNLLLPDKIWRFVWRDADAVSPEFMWQLFSSPAVRRAVSRRATGTSGSMKNISAEKLLAIPTIQPPIEDQMRFARRLRKIISLESKAEKALGGFNTLFASLQDRAFKGEL
jgi:type I restriction enzyme S subunit